MDYWQWEEEESGERIWIWMLREAHSLMISLFAHMSLRQTPSNLRMSKFDGLRYTVGRIDHTIQRASTAWERRS